jgi:hypothetical protein
MPANGRFRTPTLLGAIPSVPPRITAHLGLRCGREVPNAHPWCARSAHCPSTREAVKRARSRQSHARRVIGRGGRQRLGQHGGQRVAPPDGRQQTQLTGSRRIGPRTASECLSRALRPHRPRRVSRLAADPRAPPPRTSATPLHHALQRRAPPPRTRAPSTRTGNRSHNRSRDHAPRSTRRTHPRTPPSCSMNRHFGTPQGLRSVPEHNSSR